MRYSLEEESILADILDCSREYILAHPEIKLTKTQSAKFAKMQSLLKKGWPLAYVLGYKWFSGHKFTVNKDVLIPRPETEQLVDIADAWTKANKARQIIDVGTGSGAIIISLATEYSKGSFIGIDISSKALIVARRNQKNILKRSLIKFIKGDLLQPVLKRLENQEQVLITANLPYLSKKQLTEPSIKKEPRLALYGGGKPHNLIEKLIKQIFALNLSKSLVLLETNYDQSKILTSIIKKSQPSGKKIGIRTIKDLSGYDRFIEISIS